MLETIYVTIIILAFILTIISLLNRSEQKEIKILPFLAMILFAFAALGSANIERPFCEYITTNTTATDWSCHTQSNENAPLIYLFGGLAVIMFIAGIVIVTAKELETATRALKER